VVWGLDVDVVLLLVFVLVLLISTTFLGCKHCHGIQPHTTLLNQQLIIINIQRPRSSSQGQLHVRRAVRIGEVGRLSCRWWENNTPCVFETLPQELCEIVSLG
jgi:hypothetical protein